MIRVLVLAAALTAVAPSALAQEVPYESVATPAAPLAPPAPAAPALSPAEVEFEARAQAFGLRMQEMGVEMQNAITGAAGDAAKQDADLDGIEARYQPDVDVFVAALQAYVMSQQAVAPEAERAAMQTSLAAALPQIRAFTSSIRSQLEQAATAAPAP